MFNPVPTELLMMFLIALVRCPIMIDVFSSERQKYLHVSLEVCFSFSKQDYILHQDSVLTQVFRLRSILLDG